MEFWKPLLKADSTEWLLEDSNPSVKYFTLRWLLDMPEDGDAVISTRQKISESDSVKKLLRRQKPEGYWGTDSRPHHGTQGNLQLLMWLGYPGDDGVHQAIKYRIDGCLQDNGTYGVELKGRIVELPCHAADLLLTILWFGYEEGQAAQKLLERLVQIQGDDGVWPCVSKLNPFSCLWATADVLRAYQILPEEWMTPQIETSRRLAIEQFMNSGFFNYGKTKPSPRWLEFGFPLRFDSDILEVLGLMAPHITPDEERIQSALNLVLEKQDDNGRWPCEKHPKGGGWMKKFIEFEDIGQPSKWVTLHAMKMLKSLYTKK